jgi:hypothetical protein
MMMLIIEESEVCDPGSANRLEVLIEKSIDSEMFHKYISFTRMIAATITNIICEKRMRELEKEDLSLLQYGDYLHNKIKEYDILMK